ncbi:uncharacterized GMC-type oxidoreductase Mb1310-like [Saccostrea echinata]|uniref:uncharacterized GMC-type oxidoreductase Mb1310-like n=1 Tax=Saccostrea echinata TaxID=191078 RepID=UPI002A7EAA81|nr:uncharacterized GMC-type oxidoreductase Mb1310-like [Saccostrea echinata]
MSFRCVCLLLLVVCDVIDAQLDCSIILHGTYDYIVVGGGTSGSVIASRLSEDPDIRVLLLEAGKADDETFESHVIDTPGLSNSLVGSSVDWKYETEPQQHCCDGVKDKKVRLSRGMVLGGTSAIDSMGHIRGSEHVFDEWEQSGAEGWNFTGVKDFYKMAEDVNIKRVPLTTHRGQCGPVHVMEQKDDSLRYSMFKAGTTEMGWPVVECNIGENIGLCRSQLTIKHGNRISSAKAYLNPVKKRVNLDIQTEAKVVKILIDEYDLRATGVIFVYKGKDYTIKVRHDVILAAGPIETPKLLMLSGIGKPDHLSALNITVLEDLPIGNNLQDGYVVPLRLYVNLPTYRPDKPMENVQRWRDYIYLRRGELADGLLDAHYFLRTLPSKPTRYPDITISVVNMLPDNDHSLLMKMNVGKHLRDTWYKQGRGKNGVLLELTLMHAKSRGTVRLRSADPNDPPIIDPNYLAESEDVEDLRKGIEFIQRLAKTGAFKAVNSELEEKFAECGNHPANSQAFWRCYIRYLGYSSNELVGTARMGRLEDNTTVVDSSLRVKGIKGLRVADASIMPQSTGTTRASVIMIGEKAADIIKRDFKESKENIYKPHAFIKASKTAEMKNLDPLTSSIYDTKQSLVKLENTKPLDPVTSPLNTASETDLLSMFEQLVMDPITDPSPPLGTEAGNLGIGTHLASGILDKSGRLSENALLQIVGASSGSTKSTAGEISALASTQNAADQPADKPSATANFVKAARNTIKQAKSPHIKDSASPDIFSEIQNLSLDLQTTSKNNKPSLSPKVNTLSIERSKIPATTRKNPENSKAEATKQKPVKKNGNSIVKQKSAQSHPKVKHRIIDMHSIMKGQSAPSSVKRVIDMHSLLNSKPTVSVDATNPQLPLTLDGVLKANSEIKRPLSASLQRSRVSTEGTESLFDNHREVFPSREPDVRGFGSSAGSLIPNTLHTRRSNRRRNALTGSVFP